ncbi:MAG: EAL domain-containing protein [Stenotrophomonas sp.]
MADEPRENSAENTPAAAEVPIDDVMTPLRGLLPVGCAVALAWEDAVLGLGCRTSPAGNTRLHEAAGILLAGGKLPAGLSQPLWECWTHAESGARIVVLAEVSATYSETQRRAWLSTARALVAAVLVSMRQERQIEQLERSKRLQQALFAIADLAGSDLEMQEMFSHFHRILSMLMYAENCYIVECDETQSSLRFLYFFDTQDNFAPDPEQRIHYEDMQDSLTFAVMRSGRVMHGPSRVLLRELDPRHSVPSGPDSTDWLGVPMWRDNVVCGAIVVQSYVPGVQYDDEDRAILNFVTTHILTAMDRRQAHVQLEQHVQRRTLELEHANASLRGEVVERQRAEALQAALFNISELAMSCGSQAEFHAELHRVIGGLLDAGNFYIALINESGDGLEFVYSVDEYNRERAPRKFSGGLTEYAIRTGQPLLATRKQIDQLLAKGELHEFGAKSQSWLGVPLFSDGEVVGVIVVQSYDPQVVFTPDDQRLLAFVAHSIGNSLARQRDQNRLLQAHAELERRVTERTHELGEVNQKLLAQIGERMRIEQRLSHQAMHDSLTGLPNRLHLLERLEEAIEHARLGIGPVFALLFLDLDRFKWVNDSIGHAAGDRMLVEVARRLVGLLRGNDVVARLGGDEFAMLVRCDDGASAAMEVGRRLLRALECSMWVEGRELFPSGSIGISLWNPQYESGAELLRDADAAMYRAKGMGQDRCVVFDEVMREQSLQSLELEADLRRAIGNRDFLPFYQPIVSLHDGKVVGHEALLRWQHEGRGLLLPGDFMQLGEESGLIEQVDWLIYEQVAHDLAATASGYISVNVSPRHFHVPKFAKRLFGLLNTAGADPSRLRVELTETALLEDAPRTLRILRQLRERGIVVQLDDFGTGYSALSYLHRFPISTLKIDRSFISGLHTEGGKNTQTLVEGVVSLARTLGIETIGEGIENERQRQVLLEMGCNFGQGYLLGYPMPREATLQKMV